MVRRAAERHEAGHRSHPPSSRRGESHGHRRPADARLRSRARRPALTLGAAPNSPARSRVVFTDITASTGITFIHASAPDKKYIVESMSGGVGLFDFDKDGWLDMYLVELADGGHGGRAGRPQRAVA